ncbi:Phosphate acyltransferase,putative glycerol-3-phosphate acyltransferase PlsX,Fatty acid/phospholipid biosynthesis enzyme,fatty acid/phospholipid synthesis protein PlsX,Fatty acid synthesis protein [Chlamydia serpentis]|uniref:Phosphate acyltransferase n=1 Tax=Chlamydia serpentis TaxID=1967782 RepID=A0A2R8FCC1_9CHLA|nr:phosphate acyltransferase PlsX [Chlamydia serpentis]SPN74069.1 Phosphate acyltransferase,putative glycerol-3-phosphate acyltransferase PlsX,Fatty acid/phospholipid biosynthesis enzyme,fatty acid/phospholipid synthesis protein PlsX,Fatty acid synthesis protein [Chlamydia serpentis]
MEVQIGIDLMGGDHSPLVVWKVLVDILKCQDSSLPFAFTLFASEDVQKKIQEEFVTELPPDRFPKIIASKDFIAMEDSPLVAIRKKSSSMALGLDYLQEDKIDAFVSTGNTGALITLARTKIPLFPAVSRPALLVCIPTMQGHAVILDVGANISVKPEEIIDFARMGIAYRQCLGESRIPTIGLLNIGSEERKGTETHRQTFRMLRETFEDAFLGNIESGAVFNGIADIVVTDGFTGNIFLKTAEGVFEFLRRILGDKIETDIQHQLDYTFYPGSVVCGLSKLVIKCHGKASGPSLFQGILGSVNLAHAHLCKRILSNLL